MGSFGISIPCAVAASRIISSRLNSKSCVSSSSAPGRQIFGAFGISVCNGFSIPTFFIASGISSSGSLVSFFCTVSSISSGSETSSTVGISSASTVSSSTAGISSASAVSSSTAGTPSSSSTFSITTSGSSSSAASSGFPCSSF